MQTRRHLGFVLAGCLSLLLSVGACGGGSGGAPASGGSVGSGGSSGGSASGGRGGGQTGGAAGGGGTTPGELEIRPGASILVPTVNKVTVVSLGGGYGPEPPQGAACDNQLYTYAVTLNPGHLSFTGCDVTGAFSDPASYVPRTAEVPLAGATLETVTEAIRGVKVSASTICGADAPTRELRVESATANLTYGDDFYICQHRYPQYVTFSSLNTLINVLDGIARQP